MDNSKIRVLIKRVDKPPVVEEINNDLKALQQIVEGRIEMVLHPDFPQGVGLICNEDGKYKNLASNIFWGEHDVICGNFVIMAHDKKGDGISLTDKQIEELKEFIAYNEIPSMPEDSIEDRATLEKFQEFLQSVIKEPENDGGLEM